MEVAVLAAHTKRWAINKRGSHHKLTHSVPLLALQPSLASTFSAFSAFLPPLQLHPGRAHGPYPGGCIYVSCQGRRRTNSTQRSGRADWLGAQSRLAFSRTSRLPTPQTTPSIPHQQPSQQASGPTADPRPQSWHGCSVHSRQMPEKSRDAPRVTPHRATTATTAAPATSRVPLDASLLC